MTKFLVHTTELELSEWKSVILHELFTYTTTMTEKHPNLN